MLLGGCVDVLTGVNKKHKLPNLHALTPPCHCRLFHEHITVITDYTYSNHGCAGLCDINENKKSPPHIIIKIIIWIAVNRAPRSAVFTPVLQSSAYASFSDGGVKPLANRLHRLKRSPPSVKTK